MKKSGSLKRIITDFFDNTANYRLFAIAVLFCDIRYLLPYVFYSFVCAVLVWGGYLTVKKFFIGGRVKLMRYRILVYAFLAGTLLTALINIRSNFFHNLYYSCVLGVVFFLFYGIHAEKSAYKVKKEMTRLFDGLNFVTSFIMALGMLLLFIFPEGIRIGSCDFLIHENRFIGFIPNANAAAFYAVMAFVSCHLLYRLRKNLGTLSGRLRAYYIVCALINALAIFLTDSNDALLFMIVYFSFIAFFRVFRDFSLSRFYHFIFRLTASCLFAVIIAFSLVGTRTLTQNGVSLILTAGQSTSEISMGITGSRGGVAIKDDAKLDDIPDTTVSKSQSDSSSTGKSDSSTAKSDTDTKEKTEQEQSKEVEYTSFKHENTNIDSGRFKLWRQGLTILERSPVFGTGKANIGTYGDMYLGRMKSSVINGTRYIDFHNGLLTIAVCYGLAGFNIFIVLAMTVAKRMFKTIFRNQGNNRDTAVLVVLTAFCAAYTAYSMFEPTLLVDDTYRIFIFWLIIGFALSLTHKKSYVLRPDRMTLLERITARRQRGACSR